MNRFHGLTQEQRRERARQIQAAGSAAAADVDGNPCLTCGVILAPWDQVLPWSHAMFPGDHNARHASCPDAGDG
jgi:hypothetical protein